MFCRGDNSLLTGISSLLMHITNITRGIYYLWGERFSNCESCLWFLSHSPVLQNFSKKPRNTVLVREGQAVVLLCGPPPHYGGTVTLLSWLLLSYTPACLSSFYCSSPCCLLSSCGSAVVLLFLNHLTQLCFFSFSVRHVAFHSLLLIVFSMCPYPCFHLQFVFSHINLKLSSLVHVICHLEY